MALPRHTLVSTTAYYAAFLSLGLVLASLGPTLPGLATLVSTSLSAISAVFVARSLGYLTGALFLGRLFDRLPGHPMMAALLTTMAIMMALVPLSASIALLVIVFWLLGTAEGGLDVGANTLLIRLFPENLGPWMNGLHLFFGIGAFVSPLIVARAFLIDGTIAWPYWILAASVVPVAFWVATIKSPEIPRQPTRRSDKISSGDRTTILLIATLLFAVVGAEVGFSSWIYTYALESGLADEPTAAYLTSAFWGAFTFGRILGIPIASRFDPGNILVGDVTTCAVALLLVLVFPESSAMLWCGTILSGLAIASMFAAILTLAGRSIGITGRVAGWFFAGSSVGGMSTPWIIGQLFETTGPQIMPTVVLALLVLGLGVYALFRSQQRIGSYGSPQRRRVGR
jgi:fucose permease